MVHETFIDSIDFFNWGLPDRSAFSFHFVCLRLHATLSTLKLATLSLASVFVGINYLKKLTRNILSIISCLWKQVTSASATEKTPRKHFKLFPPFALSFVKKLCSRCVRNHSAITNIPQSHNTAAGIRQLADAIFTQQFRLLVLYVNVELLHCIVAIASFWNDKGC